MEELLTLALRGTANIEGASLPESALPDPSLAPPAGLATERTLLLVAGAWAVYRQAGHQPAVITELPPPAPEETVPACSIAAARLLEGMLNGQHAAHLPEALSLLHAAGKRLPHRLLPAALAADAEPIRQALLPVLGERGRWLSRQNPRWQWAGAALSEESLADPAALEKLWQEGSLPQRMAALGRVRANDPALARQWIQGVWKSEKAEVRAALLKAFEDRLSLDDEPFLETALDDRAGAVRTAAALLLARLPGSALAQRMIARADSMLTATRPWPSARPHLKLHEQRPSPLAGSLKLQVTPLAEADHTWQRDGLDPKPPAGMGERAWRLTSILALVPPAHWQDRFGAEPAEIIASDLDHDWGRELLLSWARAAVLHDAAAWAAPLWDRLRPQPEGGTQHPVYVACRALLTVMPQADAEARLGAILVQSAAADATGWIDMLWARHGLWSAEFGQLVLQELRKHVAALPASQAVFHDYWQNAVDAAERLLPPDCFDEAMQPWDLPDRDQWIVQHWRQRLDAFTGAIRIRRDLRAYLANTSAGRGPTINGRAKNTKPPEGGCRDE